MRNLFVEILSYELHSILIAKENIRFKRLDIDFQQKQSDRLIWIPVVRII